MLESPCPPVDEIVCPEENILGPTTIPLLIAFLRDIVTKSESPRLRTVVNTANSVDYACLVDRIA